MKRIVSAVMTLIIVTGMLFAADPIKLDSTFSNVSCGPHASCGCCSNWASGDRPQSDRGMAGGERRKSTP